MAPQLGSLAPQGLFRQRPVRASPAVVPRKCTEEERYSCLQHAWTGASGWLYNAESPVPRSTRRQSDGAEHVPVGPAWSVPVCLCGMLWTNCSQGTIPSPLHASGQGSGSRVCWHMHLRAAAAWQAIAGNAEVCKQLHTCQVIVWGLLTPASECCGCTAGHRRQRQRVQAAAHAGAERLDGGAGTHAARIHARRLRRAAAPRARAPPPGALRCVWCALNVDRSF